MATNLLIAPQRFASLGQLTANDQARVIEFITAFRANPASPGISLERLTRARDELVASWNGRPSRFIEAFVGEAEGDPR